MTIPNLLNPIIAKIERLDSDTSRYDQNRREPIGRVRRKTTITIKCQTKFFDEEDPKPGELGIDEDTMGYILVRQKDMNDQGIVLDRGDKIVELGGIPYELYITKKMSAATRLGTFQLMKLYFKDREP